MLKAIVFDFDGVIVDTEPIHYRTSLQVLEPLGVHFDYELYMQRYVGFDDRDLIRSCLIEQVGIDAQSLDEKQLAQLVEEKASLVEQIVARDGVPTMPGALELIEQLAARWPLALASGSSRFEIDVVLKRLGIADRFAVVVSTDDVQQSKPDPQSYRMAVQQLAAMHPNLALQPSECLAIEDTTAGIESARAAGLLTLGVTFTGPAEALAQAHRVVNDFEGLDAQQLLDWYED